MLGRRTNASGSGRAFLSSSSSQPPSCVSRRLTSFVLELCFRTMTVGFQFQRAEEASPTGGAGGQSSPGRSTRGRWRCYYYQRRSIPGRSKRPPQTHWQPVPRSAAREREGGRAGGRETEVREGGRAGRWDTAVEGGVVDTARMVGDELPVRGAYRRALFACPADDQQRHHSWSVW